MFLFGAYYRHDLKSNVNSTPMDRVDTLNFRRRRRNSGAREVDLRSSLGAIVRENESEPDNTGHHEANIWFDASGTRPLHFLLASTKAYQSRLWNFRFPVKNGSLSS